MIQIDMPMPDNCMECRFNTSEFGYCNAMPVEFVGQVSDFEEDGKPEWCPLKAQEPVEPKKKSFLVSGPDDYTSTPAMTVCGACDAWLLTVAPRAKYCPQCGRAVKWE